MNEEMVREWLLEYAWLGTDAEKIREVECIMAQDHWKYVSARADQYAGAQESPGPEAFAWGTGFALSELYECHDAPHLPSCPRA
jgi:hypothetical protein